MSNGMKSFSKDSTKMLFVRTAGESNALYTHIMDLSSLELGAENYTGVPAIRVPDDAVLIPDFTVGQSRKFRSPGAGIIPAVRRSAT